MRYHEGNERMMPLNKLPAVKSPKSAIFGAGVLLAVLYFWFTRSSEEAESKEESVSNRHGA